MGYVAGLSRSRAYNEQPVMGYVAGLSHPRAYEQPVMGVWPASLVLGLIAT